LVEQLIRNQQVLGSSPSAGSSFPKKLARLSTPTMQDRHRGQQLGSTRTGNPLTAFVAPGVRGLFDRHP
jgi:hypothetical protein